MVEFRAGAGLQRIGALLARTFPDVLYPNVGCGKSSRSRGVRLKRETARQNLGFSSRPLVISGLPFRRLPARQSVARTPQLSGHFAGPRACERRRFARNLLRDGLPKENARLSSIAPVSKFMTEARIWYSRDPDQQLPPGDCQNTVVLSGDF